MSSLAYGASHAASTPHTIARFASAATPSDKRCSSYSKERLYAAYVAPDEHYNFVVMPANAKADVSPLCEITYDGVVRPGGIAVDAQGKLWATDSNTPSLSAFPHAQNGPDAPAQLIQGPRTLLVGLPGAFSQAIAVDGSGNVWVPCWWGYNGSTGYVVAFNNSASGNVAPAATIGYGDKGKGESIEGPVAITFDHEGNLYVGEYSVPGRVAIFSPPFSDTSRPVAVWTVRYEANYLAVDDQDNIYVGNQQQYYVFRHGLKSNGQVWRTVGLPEGAYDIKADPDGSIFDSLIGYDPDQQVAIAALSHRATTYSPKYYITSSHFSHGGFGSMAFGL